MKDKRANKKHRLDLRCLPTESKKPNQWCYPSCFFAASSKSVEARILAELFETDLNSEKRLPQSQIFFHMELYLQLMQKIQFAEVQNLNNGY